MEPFISWTINAIREDPLISRWLDERKYEWVPIVSNFIRAIFNEKSVIIINETKYDWFCKYVLLNINSPLKGRPYIPIYDIKGIYPNLNDLKSPDGIELLKDMLDISFPNGYIFWYIGMGNGPISKVAKNTENSFMWVIDEQIPNAFLLKSNDEELDFKFLQMYRLLDKTLTATLFGEVDVDD